MFRLVPIDAYSRKSDKSLRHNVDKQTVLSSSNNRAHLAMIDNGLALAVILNAEKTLSENETHCLGLLD